MSSLLLRATSTPLGIAATAGMEGRSDTPSLTLGCMSGMSGTPGVLGMGLAEACSHLGLFLGDGGAVGR